MRLMGRSGTGVELGLRRAARILVGFLLVFVVLVATVWACLALWYRLPATEPVRALAGALFAVLGLATVVAIFSRFRFHGLVLFVVAFSAVLIWWSTIRPLQVADWAPDVARQVTGTRQGDLLTLTNVRDFEWRSATDFTERWTQRTYDLAKLRTLDLFMSYWAGPEMAHVIMSFGFENDRLPRLVDRGAAAAMADNSRR